MLNYEQKIPFRNLKSTDQVIINTQNHEYQFEILNPATRSGILSGGRLGDSRHKAIFLFTSQGSEVRVSSNSIRTNASAVFLLELNDNLAHLYTSQIKNLQLKRDASLWETVLTPLENLIKNTSNPEAIPAK
ncbi:MAG: hypothetical protein WAQ98_05685 [Blastocatellia bacterium]